MELFVYGTLMDDFLVTELTGRRFRRSAAVLPGYGKTEPPGGYPYIAPTEGAHVDGFVLHDIDSAALRALDRYEDEGQLYRRVDVLVDVCGAAIAAMAYIGIAASR